MLYFALIYLYMGNENRCRTLCKGLPLYLIGEQKKWFLLHHICSLKQMEYGNANGRKIESWWLNDCLNFPHTQCGITLLYSAYSRTIIRNEVICSIKNIISNLSLRKKKSSSLFFGRPGRSNDLSCRASFVGRMQFAY